MKLKLLCILGIALLVGCSNITATETILPATDLGVVVDNRDEALSFSGPWTAVQSTTAYNGECLTAPFWKNPSDGTLDPDRYATSTANPDLPQEGMYEVYVWWCDASIDNLATQQRLWLCASQGYSCVTVYSNPQEQAGEWHSLGTYYMNIDGSVTVQNGESELGAPPGWEVIANGAVVIDALRFVYRGPRAETLTPLPFVPHASPTPEINSN